MSLSNKSELESSNILLEFTNSNLIFVYSGNGNGSNFYANFFKLNSQKNCRDIATIVERCYSRRWLFKKHKPCYNPLLMPTKIMTISTTKGAVSVTISVPEASLHIIIGVVTIVLVFILFIGFLRHVAKATIETEAKQEEHPVELHLHIKELRDAMVAEMRSTSRQNWIMILLTIIFITVSIFSGSILILFRRIPSLATYVTDFVKSLIGK